MATVHPNAPPPGSLIHNDVTQLARLQTDLEEKAKLIYKDSGKLKPMVLGIFSLDHMDQMREADLCDKLAIGVGYFRTLRAQPDANQQNTGSLNAARMVEIDFIIILALPTNDRCTNTATATEMLTRLRLGIDGSPVKFAAADQRKWQFVQEGPVIDESSRTVLYYSQVWRFVMPALSKPIALSGE